MRPLRTKTRTLTALLAAGIASFALAASAAAVVYVYSNGFNNRAAVQDVKRVGGGKSKCDRTFRQRSKSLGVSVKGKRLCKYSPLVVGDANQPDQAMYAKGRIVTRNTPKSLRRAAYLAVQVRFGRGEYYELQVRPQGRRFKLLRNPGSGAVSEAGQSNAINRIKKSNTLLLIAKGGRITAKVNGHQVAEVVDPEPNAVSGRRVAFGIGSTRNSSRATLGAFERVRVGIP